MLSAVAGDRSAEGIGSAPAASDLLRGSWFLILAAAIWTLPTLIDLARTSWTTEQGAHGPIILCTGLWALHMDYRAHAGEARRGRQSTTVGVLIGAALLYVLARLLGYLPLACVAVFVGLVGLLYAQVGGRILRRLWFPLVYLLFLTPPPQFLIQPLTRALKLWISSTSVDLLFASGYEVASSGTSLFIDQYELLVEAACSGLNSMVSLLAIGLFYVYLRRRNDWRYAALLIPLIVPIAIVANLVRVLILMLLVHYWGEAVLRTQLHEAAGYTMFFVGLLTLILVDAALSPVRRRLERARSA